MTAALRPRIALAKMVSWRTTEQLYSKLAVLAAAEACRASQEAGIEARLSVNEVLNHAASRYVADYESTFGELPESTDVATLKKYVAKK